jgi:hypothetical protein
LLTLMSNQSTVRVKPRKKVGVNTAPAVKVSPTSGWRWVLPPFSSVHWPDGHWMMLPYWPAVTPLRSHWARVAVGAAPAQGSLPENRPGAWAANSSFTFGARTARA